MMGASRNTLVVMIEVNPKVRLEQQHTYDGANPWARTMLGWSQVELAKAANVSRQTVGSTSIHPFGCSQCLEALHPVIVQAR
ncbi:helix-turn-helix transcriptional regulator [Rhizobium lusitanum]|uniref:helix-turn-helix transcriptional regulator n=1 Tax=Rhizobium lusitanum TaxID=293958 RepID=UPI0028AD1CCF|nr:helix-turn-helix domain-containing protein [Rhizobium lusitanum]